MDWKEVLVQAALPIVKAVGQAELSMLLDKFKENNSPQLYAALLRGLYGDLQLLDEVAIKTKTKIDDGLIDVFMAAISFNANRDSIELI